MLYEFKYIRWTKSEKSESLELDHEMQQYQRISGILLTSESGTVLLLLVSSVVSTELNLSYKCSISVSVVQHIFSLQDCILEFLDNPRKGMGIPVHSVIFAA